MLYLKYSAMNMEENSATLNNMHLKAVLKCITPLSTLHIVLL